MALHKVSAHPRCCRNRSLQVDFAILLEGAQICSSQGLGRDTDLEGGFVERGYGQASSIYADAVPKMAIVQDFGRIGDRERCAAIFGLVIELGDNWRKSVKLLNQFLKTQTSNYLNDSGKHGGLDCRGVEFMVALLSHHISPHHGQIVYPVIR
jgi:hypothetical protein